MRHRVLRAMWVVCIGVAAMHAEPATMQSHAPTELAGDSPDSCLGRVVHGQQDFVNGVPAGLKLFPRDRTASRKFAILGFRVGDLYKPSDGRPPTIDSLQADIFSGGNHNASIPLSRFGQTMTLEITPAQIASALGHCHVTRRP